jgi:spore coat protein U-like protein
MNKKNKIFFAKSTTALTSLFTVLININNVASALETTNTFTPSVAVGSSCTISTPAMGFAAWTDAAARTDGLEATIGVLVNCTNNTPYSISFTNSDHTTGMYKLTRDSTDGVATTNYLNIWFKNAAAATMSNIGATIIGTGSGISATAGTVTGVIPASQLGRFAGTFAKVMTMQITY